ncbi:MAG TPA: hypothetical protein VKA98_07735 [Nitrososphaeraceae archaeon]|nr:hypothetical protein [Nitrososphaeraceae archaeon]
MAVAPNHSMTLTTNRSMKTVNIIGIIRNKLTLERLLQLVIVIAGVILGTVICYTVYLYPRIPIHWKVAIITFILFLPVSYFLQIFFNSEANKDERKSRIRKAFRHEYSLYVEENKPDYISDDELKEKDSKIYVSEIEKRSKFIIERGDIKLDSIYRQAYLNTLDQIGDQKNLSQPLIEKRRILLNFELDENKEEERNSPQMNDKRRDICQCSYTTKSKWRDSWTDDRRNTIIPSFFFILFISKIMLFFGGLTEVIVL